MGDTAGTTTLSKIEANHLKLKENAIIVYWETIGWECKLYKVRTVSRVTCVACMLGVTAMVTACDES